MDKPIIRSIALFLEKPGERNTKEYTDYVIESLRLVDQFRRKLETRGYTVFTKRLVLPELPLKKRVEVIEDVEPRDTLISIGSIDVEEATPETILNIVDQGYYLSLQGVWRNPVIHARRVSEIIHRVSEINPVNATRIAVGFHENLLETPYFPDSTSSGTYGVGYSFLFPRHMIKYVEEHDSLDGYTSLFKEYVEELISIARDVLGVDRVLFDYSISPWINDSVVELIERLGYKFLSPGFNYGIHVLNRVIEGFVREIGYESGFNEVMLPYAEDSRLINAGAKGLIRARDLLLYSSTCIVGPDMIVVPASIESVSYFILDTYSIWCTKNRAMALRIIPVPNKPGDTVKLGKFGEIPVINY